jgi:hypothetical protein
MSQRTVTYCNKIFTTTLKIQTLLQNHYHALQLVNNKYQNLWNWEQKGVKSCTSNKMACSQLLSMAEINHQEMNND